MLCLALIGSPHIVAAQSVQDQIIAQLRDQGFTEMTVNRTFLGRVRVVAIRDGVTRELVFHPQTGAILRDYWVTDSTSNRSARPQIIDRRDDDDRRDRDDDDDDDRRDRDDDRDDDKDDDRDDDDNDDDDDDSGDDDGGDDDE